MLMLSPLNIEDMYKKLIQHLHTYLHSSKMSKVRMDGHRLSLETPFVNEAKVFSAFVWTWKLNQKGTDHDLPCG